MKKIKPIQLNNVISRLKGNSSYELIGNPDVLIESVSGLENAIKNSIIWVSKKKIESVNWDVIHSSVLVGPRELKNHLPNTVLISVLLTDNPRLLFALIVNNLFDNDISYGIHPSAIINPEAQIGKNVFIGAGSVIGRCSIGDNTKINANCYIHDNTNIGENVNIAACTVIGGPGFGYERDVNGEWVLFPHIGGVIIEDNVDIGANTCIDRGALGNTILKKGCKVDNLVHIAHNVIVEEGALVIAHAMIAGSVIVGRNSWVAPGALVKNGLTVGENSVIGLGAVVVKNIPDNETWVGNPAKPILKS